MLIVLPFCNKDAIAAVKNVAWMKELDGKTAFECMLSWPVGTQRGHIEKMRAAAQQVFSKVHEFEYPESELTTWPAGANWAWQQVARWIPMITNYKGNSYPFEKVLPAGTPWLFLEPDAVPLKPGWMTTLFDEYKKGGKPFMGHIVQDMGHMNGVGIYPNNVSHFTKVALHAIHSAWDVMLKEETIELTHNANHLIQHCWGLASNDRPQHRGDDPVASFRDVSQMWRVLNAVKDEWRERGCPGIEPNPVLFHRTKDGSLIDCLMQAKASPTSSEITQKREGVASNGPSQQERDGFKSAPEASASVTDPNVCREGQIATGPACENPVTNSATVETDSKTGYVPVEEVRQVATPVQFPKTDIFIVTFAGDCGFRTDEKMRQVDCNWLRYCLHSIKKFASGFNSTVVLCPDRDIDVIEPVCREWGPDNTIIELFTEPEEKGMLAHMAMECSADQFCQADFTLHIDSDCIFAEPVTPADYFVNGKPVLLMEEYERFRGRYDAILRWKETSEAALGWTVTHEFMRRHPAVHYRSLYPQVRKAVEAKHKKPFWDWAISGQNSFPQSWSEYNVIGAVAWKLMRDKYHWIDLATDIRPKDKILQMWSHGGLDRPTDNGPYVPETPRNVLRKVLGI